jgi:HD-GYP domain-containing protein (c-di-GMP phosphodiesterase class II)
MSQARASDRQITAVREVLRAMSSGRQVYALYPSGHPNRDQASRDLRDAVAGLREERPGDPVVFVTDGNFYLGPTLLAWESLTLYGLIHAFADAGVQSLEFGVEVTQTGMDALLRLLSGESQDRNAVEGVSVNRAGPGAAPPDVEASMTELLHRYAAGLDLLRQTAARMLAGRSADMDATVRLTEHLADLISSDPAQALLLTTVKSYDEYTFHHMVNVCILSLALARALGLPRDQAISLGIGGLLHDVGKVKVPAEILQHDGALDEEQWRVIQRHPVDGAGLVLITSRNAYHPAVATVLEHHASFDGSGYPTLSGRRSPSLPARIVAVADCFDAVTSKRAYRKAEERRQALSLIQAGAGRAFDPRVVRTFVRMVGIFPVGSLVQLSTGDVAIVIRNHERLLASPTVRLVLGADGEERGGEELDLSREEEGAAAPSVVRSVDPAEVGVDMLSLLASGRFDVPPPPDTGPGLQHDPAPTEAPPEGYVDAHDELAPHDLPLDPDAGPPPEADDPSH